MGDANPDERSSIHTVERTIVFQRMPASGAIAGPVVIKPTEVPVEWKLTTDTDTTGHTGTYQSAVKLDGLVPDTPTKLEIFGSKFDLVVKGDVQTDPKKLSWYRERLYMMGYVSTDELDLDDLDLPDPAGDDKVFFDFRKKLTQEFLEGLLSFQIDHNLSIDENILGDSEVMKSTRSLLDLNAGT